jgi:hypothetical protein
MANKKPFRNCYLSKANSPLNISPNSESPMMLHAPVMARFTLNRPDVHQEIVANYIKYSDKYWSDVLIRQRIYLKQQRQEKLELAEQTKRGYKNFLPKETLYGTPIAPHPNTKHELNSAAVVFAHVSPKSTWRELWSCVKPHH